MTMPFAAKASMGGLVVIAVAGIGWGMSYDESTSSTQTTDDAYVQADFSTVAPRVAGTIARVLVADNQPVRKGQLLTVIDDRDYQLALASSLADLDAAKTRVEGVERQIARQTELIAQAKASIAADDAAVSLSQANAERYHDLASDGSASRQEQQEASARLASDQAVRQRDLAGHGAVRAQTPILQADLADARASVARATAAVNVARLNLSYTQIHAPLDGTVGQRTVRVGNYVQVGAPLLAIVPVEQAYVEAHYRETQLARIRTGQRAKIALDALPGVTLDGHVESIAPASGVSFSSIAPENATGNFTKIAQRLAVRIAIEPNQKAMKQLHMGMSVVPTIRTDL